LKHSKLYSGMDHYTICVILHQEGSRLPYRSWFSSKWCWSLRIARHGGADHRHVQSKQMHLIPLLCTSCVYCMC